MLRKQVDGIQDETVRKSLEHVLENGLGNPSVLSASPTTAGAELKDNELGFDGTNLFITIQGTTYQINLTAV